jgi:mannuronan 5-epimerase
MRASSLNSLLLLLLFLVLMLSSPLLVQKPSAYASPECIGYDPRNNTIVISCGNANLTDVYNALNANVSNPGILNKGPDKVWTLNANIKVENNTYFYINSTDTSWLKINSTFSGVVGKEPNHILARGNMIIDSVKITSWDTTKNDYARANGTIPRSYILVNYGNGTTNITNSELAYLGYPHARSFGLTYYTGAGSIIKNNKIHDLWYGFYSDGFAGGAYNITIEGNEVYNNKLYGIDPHSGTHDMIIRNNTVHNNSRGIICSTDCYNIIIESNNVFTNGRFGIKLHNNVSNSTIANNTVRNNKMEQISIYNSNDNSVNANNIRGGEYGIIVVGSANNNIYNNVMANSSSYGIFVNSSSSGNIFNSNRIKDSLTSAIKINGSYAVKNFFNDNQLSDSFHAISLSDNSGTTFTNNTVTNIKNSAYLLSNVSEIRFNRTSFSYDIIESDGTDGNFIIIANSGTIGIKEDRSDKFVNYNTNRSTLNYNASKYAILDSNLEPL